ncbi:histidine kinase N-terminal 7TM domain-containing protein [Algoriphagus sp. C2-6-M1]|uniref:histidine kinase N-terminal 7TM domain-containing protein n=1 Tax=Algoriphagus persicinus TaxID=3108754 RepID=UPI002B3A24F7|nr:histidine kinase N-terminal 7TM domain-containing protein [Algoriphagus sp. C2-6-M1]MEB2781258.1 histidine kinase N-terminal 7TM domain-containing protein [Algoriphagus sp. C2-6-M1]
MYFNLLSVLLAVIPMLLNVGLLYIIGVKMPKDERTNIFIFLLLCLVFWQLEAVLLRISTTYETKVLIDRFLSMGWIFVGSFLLHFISNLVNFPFAKSWRFKLLNYGITLIFFLLYLNYPQPHVFSEHPFFGSIPSVRPGSPDIISRFWISFQSFFGLVLILKFLKENHHKKSQDKRVTQVKWVLAGIILPVLSGFVTHVVFPWFGVADLAITSSTMTIFTVCTYFGMKKADLFNYFELIPLDKIMKEMSNFFILFDKDLNVILKNEYADRLIFNESSKSVNLESFLTPESKRRLIQTIDQNKEVKWLDRLNFLDSSQEPLPSKAVIQKIEINKNPVLYLLIGTDGKELLQYKQKLSAFKEYFRYFLKTSNESFFELDPESGSISWNDSEYKIFGLKPQIDIFSFGEFEKYFNQSRSSLEFEKLLNWVNSDEIKPIILHFEINNCKEKTQNLTLNAIKLRKGSTTNNIKVIGTLRDVSSEFDYFKQISKRDLALKEIIWVQSHKVRAPLANILALTDILKTDDNLCKTSNKEFLTALEASAIQLDMVIKEIVNKASVPEEKL